MSRNGFYRDLDFSQRLRRELADERAGRVRAPYVPSEPAPRAVPVVDPDLTERVRANWGPSLEALRLPEGGAKIVGDLRAVRDVARGLSLPVPTVPELRLSPRGLSLLEKECRS